MRLIVGISGASGAILGIRLLETLSRLDDVETHLVVSKAGERIIEQETTRKIDDLRALADYSYSVNNIGASIASGSFKRDGMIVMPCSVKTMSAIANSYAENLLVRAADVTLKERKPLIIGIRETPFHLGHIRSMLQLAEMGAVIMPPIPSFYHQPESIMDIVDHIVGRALDLFDLRNDLSRRWVGEDISL